MTVYILLIVVTAALGGALVVMYLDLKKVKVQRSRLSKEFKEFENALRQAEDYSDKKGWISIEWVNRDDHLPIRRKK